MDLLMRRDRRADRYILSLNPVLYIPFNKYGLEQQKAWDISGNNNHGTIVGATPALIPMLKGIELVSNGGMESGNPPTGWSATSSPETFEQSAVQKHSGSNSAHIVDSTPSCGGFRQAIPTILGKRYKISYWYYIVSGGLQVDWGSGASRIFVKVHTTTGSWLYWEGITSSATATENIFLYFFNNSDSVAGEFYIDDVSIQEVVGYQGGQGWQFDGVDDYVDCGNNASLDITDAITIEAWIYLNNAYQSWIIGRSGSYNHGYLLGTSSSSEMIVAVGGGTDYRQIGSTTIEETGKWIHIAATYIKNGSNTKLELFRNGVSVQSGTVERVINNSNLNLQIGKWAGTYFFKGTIGKVYICNRALTPSEIRNIYELTRHKYGR